MSEIITDLEQLNSVASMILPQKNGKLVQETVIKLKKLIRENNLDGLSAPQIGVPYRIIVVKFEGDKLRSFVDPIISKWGNKRTFSTETCPSIPDKKFLMFRDAEIQVVSLSPLGQEQKAMFYGAGAFKMQQQMEILDGIFPCDYGLEIDDDFLNASEEEQMEIKAMYLESLDVQAKAFIEEVKNDEEVKPIYDAIDFMEGVQTGKVNISREAVSKEDSEKIEEKLKAGE